MKLLALLMLFSCSQIQYISGSKECAKGEWKMLTHSNGKPVKRPLSSEEKLGNKLWEARVQTYKFEKQDLSIKIMNSGEIYINEIKVYQISNLSQEKRNFYFNQTDKSIELIEHIEGAMNTYSFNHHDYKFQAMSSTQADIKNLAKFENILRINPRSGERFRSEFSPLGYRCLKK